MLVKDLRQMLAEALRIGHARCVVLFTIERHTDTLSSGWFHGADSPYGAVCSIHSIGREVESSYCLHRFSTNHEIRWNQRISNSIKRCILNIEQLRGVVGLFRSCAVPYLFTPSP